MNLSHDLRKIARTIVSGEMQFTDTRNIKDVKVLKPNQLYALDGAAVPPGGYMVSTVLGNEPGMPGAVMLQNMDNPQTGYEVSYQDLLWACQHLYAEVNDFNVL